MALEITQRGFHFCKLRIRQQIALVQQNQIAEFDLVDNQIDDVAVLCFLIGLQIVQELRAVSILNSFMVRAPGYTTL